MERMLDRIAKASLGIKLGAVFGALAVITLVNLFLVGVPYGPSITAIDDRQVKAEADLARLGNEFVEKQAIANDLNRFRREKETLQQRLDEAKSELPEEKNVDELLQVFQDRAIKAGLEIVSVEPKEQVAVAGSFYARLPITMSVDGNFHEIATFFDALGRLRRIVNVSDLVFDRPRDVSGRVVVTSNFVVTAFMFVDPKLAAPAKGKGQPVKGAQ